MKCPNCGAARLVSKTRDFRYAYKGDTTTIPRVKGEYCPACGEAVLDASESARVSAAMLAFNRKVNAAMVDPDFIARVRRKLALDQKQAARPPLALVQLLKLLDRHPEQLEELRR